MTRAVLLGKGAHPNTTGRTTRAGLPIIAAKSLLERHVFDCQNLRDADNPKGCCADKGAAEVLDRLRHLAHEAGLKGRMRINASGCLGQCAHGLTIVVYPEAVWYRAVKLSDADEIFHEHVLGGRPVTRLLLRPPDAP